MDCQTCPQTLLARKAKAIIKEHYAVYSATCCCTCSVLLFHFFVLIQVKILRQVQVFWFLLLVFLPMVRVCPVVVILRLK